MNALRQARAELERAKKGIRKRVTVDASSLRGDKSKVDALAGEVSKHAPQKPKPAGSDPTADDLKVGQSVTVISLGNQGVVAEAPKKGQVLVQVGLIKTRVPFSDLRLAKKKRKPSGNRTPRGSIQVTVNAAVDDAMVRSPDSTLDLRGERADDAIARVDQFLDSSVLCSRECVFVVHGHGTGALRTAVRAHLQGHPSISKWRRGEQGEGGDGVTLAWLRD